MTRVSVHSGTCLRLTLGALLLIGGSATAEDLPHAVPPTPIQALLQKGSDPVLKAGRMSDFHAELVQLYGLNGGAPLWLKDGRPTPQASALVESLGEGAEHGLDPAAFEAQVLLKRLEAATSAPTANQEEVAALDLALSLSALRYGAGLALGRVDPRSLDFDLDVASRRAELPGWILEIARSDQPKALIYGKEPALPVYRSLLEALARYRKLGQEAAAPKLAFPAKFGPGGHHKDIPALRNWLFALGDLKELPVAPAQAPAGPVAATPAGGGEAKIGPASDFYDPELAAAVKSFQKRHGLAADGVLGKGTVAQLNVPPAERVQQIQLALERLRWLPDSLRGLYLVVNIPAFQLYASRNGQGLGDQDLEMNVIVGQAVDGRRTPVFHADMAYVIFHPYWNVPDTIAAKELVPIIQRNPGYLARNNLEIVSHFSPNAAAHAPSGASLARLASGSLKLRMKPGPRNALGLVKFSFPNNNNVYLHSTPAKGLFQRSRRDFSHGCIRVQDPVRLAEWVLSQQPEWTHERIVAAMEGSKEKTVTLSQRIPVYIFYSTVSTDADGRVRFFEDIYGHDKALAEALAKGFPYPPPKTTPPPPPVNPATISAGNAPATGN